MRKGLLGLAAGSFLGFGALMYSEDNALARLHERNPDLTRLMETEVSLGKVNETYVRLPRLEQMCEGPDYMKRYNELLTYRNRLLETPAVQEGIKDEKRYGRNITGLGAMTLISLLSGVFVFLGLVEKKKPEE